MPWLTRRRGWTRASAVALLSLLSHAADATPQSDSALVVILDVSGSMREAVEGGVKAELAPRQPCPGGTVG